MHTQESGSEVPAMLPDAGDASVADPLRYFAPLPLESTFYPLGYAVRLHTNSADVMAAASAIWGGWEQDSDAPAVELYLGVSGAESARPSPVPLPTAQGHLMTIAHSPLDFATADVERGFIFGWVAESTAADHGYLQFHFLEPLAYVTLGCMYLAPVHASCAALDGKALVFSGDSGAGKTSLVYALARRGWTYVSDDATYVRRHGRSPRVIGRPHHIRFRSSAKTLFPELAGFPEVRRQNGNCDLELSTAALGLDLASQMADVAALVFLERKAGARVQIHPADREQASRKLEQVICFGPAGVRAEQKQALRKLSELPAYRFIYSDLDQAEQALRALLKSE